MTKKKTPGKKNVTIPGVEYSTVVKGFTERTRWRVSSENITPEAIEWMKKAFPSGPENSFERRIIYVEAQSKRILEHGDLPTYLGCHYAIPGGEKVTLPAQGDCGSLVALVEARGYRERIDPEWFAAQILIDIRDVRNFTAKDDAVEAAANAASLGELVGEAKALGYFAQTGTKGGSKEKKIRPLMEWLRRTVKEYPDKPYTFYWDSLPKHDDGDRPILVNGAEIIREGGVLVVTDDGERPRSLAFPSFRRYFDDVKKSLKKVIARKTALIMALRR